MTEINKLKLYLGACPLIAIVRGVAPDEVEAITDAIFDAGIRIIEVPMNSPEPLESIRRLAAHFGDRALIGAGTVLDAQQVSNVRSAGGHLIVSPSTKRDVIAAAASAGMISCPGYFTPTEAFEAIDAGATALKLFPADGGSPAMLKALRAVLPSDLPILVVGGITPETMRPWLDAGANGFGLGGALYRAGQSAEVTAAKARAFVEALER